MLRGDETPVANLQGRKMAGVDLVVEGLPAKTSQPANVFDGVGDAFSVRGRGDAGHDRDLIACASPPGASREAWSVKARFSELLSKIVRWSAKSNGLSL